MKFTEDLGASAQNYITGIDSDHVVVQRKKINASYIIAPDALVKWGIKSFDEITSEHIPLITALKPEVIILGTGERHIIPDKPILKALVESGIGYEIMKTSAACRTYNILIAEDRRAVVALII